PGGSFGPHGIRPGKALGCSTCSCRVLARAPLTCCWTRALCRARATRSSVTVPVGDDDSMLVLLPWACGSLGGTRAGTGSFLRFRHAARVRVPDVGDAGTQDAHGAAESLAPRSRRPRTHLRVQRRV